MSTFGHSSLKKILFVLMIVIVLLSVTFLRTLVQPLNFSEDEAKQTVIMESNRSYNAKGQDLEIYNIFSSINQSISNVPFTWTNKTTSGKNSRAILLNHKKKYHIGDDLLVRIDMFDYLGERKTYGGDFLRARIYSQYLGAGASGMIEDFNNGSYLIHFALSWEGNVSISIILLHPSEGVSILWKARNTGFKNIMFTGKFLNNSHEIHMECGFHLESQEQMCEYEDRSHGEFFYCIKPPNVPCEAFISLKSKNKPHSYLSDMEKSIFTRSNIGVEIPINSGRITVLKSQDQVSRAITEEPDRLLSSGHRK